MHQLQRSWFDPGIRRHNGIWGAADEAVLNIVRKYSTVPWTILSFYISSPKLSIVSCYIYTQRTVFFLHFYPWAHIFSSVFNPELTFFLTFLLLSSPFFLHFYPLAHFFSKIFTSELTLFLTFLTLSWHFFLHFAPELTFLANFNSLSCPFFKLIYPFSCPFLLHIYLQNCNFFLCLVFSILSS